MNTGMAVRNNLTVCVVPVAPPRPLEIPFQYSRQPSFVQSGRKFSWVSRSAISAPAPML